MKSTYVLSLTPPRNSDKIAPINSPCQSRCSSFYIIIIIFISHNFFSVLAHVNNYSDSNRKGQRVQMCIHLTPELYSIHSSSLLKCWVCLCYLYMYHEELWNLNSNGSALNSKRSYALDTERWQLFPSNPLSLRKTNKRSSNYMCGMVEAGLFKLLVYLFILL